MAIAPFWFSMEHLWSAITPFGLSTDNIYISDNIIRQQIIRVLKSLYYVQVSNLVLVIDRQYINIYIRLTHWHAVKWLDFGHHSDCEININSFKLIYCYDLKKNICNQLLHSYNTLEQCTRISVWDSRVKELARLKIFVQSHLVSKVGQFFWEWLVWNVIFLDFLFPHVLGWVVGMKGLTYFHCLYPDMVIREILS